METATKKIVANQILIHFYSSMRDAVYRAVMVTANRQTFNQLKNLYRNADLAEEKNRILHAFGYCQDPNILSLGKSKFNTVNLSLFIPSELYIIESIFYQNSKPNDNRIRCSFDIEHIL